MRTLVTVYIRLFVHVTNGNRKWPEMYQTYKNQIIIALIKVPRHHNAMAEHVTTLLGLQISKC